MKVDYIDDNNCWIVRYTISASPTVKLIQKVGGVETERKSLSVPAGNEKTYFGISFNALGLCVVFQKDGDPPRSSSAYTYYPANFSSLSVATNFDAFEYFQFQTYLPQSTINALNAVLG